MRRILIFTFLVMASLALVMGHPIRVFVIASSCKFRGADLVLPKSVHLKTKNL
jgi:hypothetical protein